MVFGAPTGFVSMLNVADGCPAGTVTEAGTCVSPSLLSRVTFAPAAGAGPVNMTVPVVFSPPTTCIGLMLTDAKDESLAMQIQRSAVRTLIMGAVVKERGF